MDVIIFSGQSNMQGQSECLSEHDVVKDAYEYKWLTDELLPLQNPVGENITYSMDQGYDVTPETHIPSWLKEHALGAACYGNTNLVPSFCRTYTEITKRQVFAVHAAKGSTKISEWLPGTPIYDVLIRKARGAIQKVNPERIADKIPKNVQQVFWDYYRPDEEFYSTNIDKHRQLGDNTMFAGGVWMWSSHCPLFSHSIANSVPALEACRKKGVREVLATVWHNGSECSLILSLALLALYADYDYRGCYAPESIARCFRYATGERYEDFLKLELPEHPNESVISCTRALLYNDPLLGLVDKHVERLESTSAYYAKVLEELSPLGSDYKPAFQTVRALTDLLINKADFGMRLTRAYRENDRATLANMEKECDVIIQKINVLRAEHRTAWMKYNKPFGWKVHDIRYGGLKTRFETVREYITDYLSGAVSAIEELEAERLRFDCAPEDADPFGKQFLWYSYSSYTTVGRL